MSKIKLASIQTEIDASYLYKLLSEHESDAVVAEIFVEMSAIERGHAEAFMKANNLPVSNIPSPSIRARALNVIGKIIGYEFVLGVLLDMEKSLSVSIVKARQSVKSEIGISDTSHVAILKNILNNTSRVAGGSLARFEKRHRSVGGNALRAAVLGGNDGLVSNFSLMMGVAGAAGGQQPVLLAGMAGMLAGALSMALGEWISVKSSQELNEHQMSLEMEELTVNPAGEEKEIALIYMAKGIPREQAQNMATEKIKDTKSAHEFLVREELGISPEELHGSAMEAAVASFFLFAIGAIIPLIPFFFMGGFAAIILSTILSAFGLFLIGAAITLFTGKSIWFSGMRQVLFGLAAAAITFGLGHLIGVSIAG